MMTTVAFTVASVFALSSPSMRITQARSNYPVAYPKSIAAAPDDRVTVAGDRVEVETIKDGIGGPTSVALGPTLWITEGQLPHLFEAAKNGPPQLPFRIIAVPMPGDADPDTGSVKQRGL